MIRSSLHLSLLLSCIASTSAAQGRDVSKLIAGLEDDATWSRSAAHLVLSGANAAAPLMEMVARRADEKKAPKLFRRVLVTLDRMGLNGHGGARRLREMLLVFTPENRLLAIEVFAQVYPRSQIPGGPLFKRSLTAYLRHYTPEFAQKIVDTVSAAEAAIKAKISLEKLDVAALVDRLEHCTVVDRNGICQALGALGPRAKRALPELTKRLESVAAKAIPEPPSIDEIGRDRFGRNLADAILRIAPGSLDAGSAYGYLILADSIPDLRIHATRRLARLGANGKRAFPMLVEVLKREKHDDVRLLCVVIQCVRAVGPHTGEAIPHLERLRHSRNALIAATAKAAITGGVFPAIDEPSVPSSKTTARPEPVARPRTTPIHVSMPAKDREKLPRMWGARVGGAWRLRGKNRPAALAIDRGLIWLANHQNPAGFWHPAAFVMEDRTGKPCDGVGTDITSVELTGTTLLAFFGNAHTITRGAHCDSVAKGVRWLIANQERSGEYEHALTKGAARAHAISTYAMAEATLFAKHLGEPDRASVARSLRRALSVLLKSQHTDGGWGNRPARQTSDVLTTYWAFFALWTAEHAGILTNKEITPLAAARERVRKRFEALARDEKSQRPRRESCALLHALCFMVEGSPTQDAGSRALLQSICARPPRRDDSPRKTDRLDFLMASNIVYQASGPYWDQWTNRNLRAEGPVQAQRMDGNFVGSWDPIGVDHAGGRVHATALMTLSLQSFYRFDRRRR